MKLPKNDSPNLTAQRTPSGLNSNGCRHTKWSACEKEKIFSSKKEIIEFQPEKADL